MNWLKKVWAGLVNFGFRLLYNEMAWSYDAVSWLVSLGEWRAWQLASLAFLPEPAVGSRSFLVEIGHGPGHMLIETARRGFVVTGCDLSRSMGRLAQARPQPKDIHPISVVRGAVPDLPFLDGRIDVVLSQFPTRYILKPETAAEIYRLLKPGGRLVILPEGHLTGLTPVHRFIAWLFRITGQNANPAGSDLNKTIRSVWTNLYNQAGFETEIHVLQRPRSQCTVIIAEKPQTPTPTQATGPRAS